MKVGDEVIWLGDAWARQPFNRNQLGVVESVDERGRPVLVRVGAHLMDPSYCPSFVVPVVKVAPDHDSGDEDQVRR